MNHVVTKDHPEGSRDMLRTCEENVDFLRFAFGLHLLIAACADIGAFELRCMSGEQGKQHKASSTVRHVYILFILKTAEQCLHDRHMQFAQQELVGDATWHET